MKWRDGAVGGAELQLGTLSSLTMDPSRSQTETILTVPEWMGIKSVRSELKSEQWASMTCPLLVGLFWWVH